MITDITRWGAFKPLLCAFFVLGLSGVLLAQVAPHAGGAAERDILRVRRFPKPSKALLLRTPEYNTSVARSGGSRRPREWMVHETNYETRPEWIDSLDFSYTVMMENRTPDGKKEFNLFQATIRYSDIAKGEHIACVVLPPPATARFGEIAGIALEITMDGNIIETQSEVKIDGLPAEWWKNPRVLDNPNVVRRPGYLVDRSKTPFGLINIDNYEMVK